MALPAGALTATITVGAPIDIAGAAGTLVSLHVRPDVPAGLVWAADGTPIEPWSASPAAGEAPVTSASLEVLADQPGVLTSSTVAGAAAMVEIRSWPLVAVWTTRQSATGAPTRHVRRLNAPAPGTTLDLDLLPADGVTVPATVTYAQTLDVSTDMVADLSVGTVATGAPGTPAAAALTATGDAYALDLTIPQGDKGDPGDQGAPGPKGDKGDPGAAGPKGDTGSAAEGAAYPLTNLVTNGSFEIDTNGDGIPDGYTNGNAAVFTFAASSDAKYGSKSLAVTCTGAGWRAAINQGFTAASGHLYYRAVWVKTSLVDAVATLWAGTAATASAIAPIPTGAWSLVSGLARSNATGSVYQHTYLQRPGDANFAPGDFFLLDGSFNIDLTAAFGAGNEPSLEEMDRIITHLGHFDGTAGLAATTAAMLELLRTKDDALRARETRLASGMFRVGTWNAAVMYAKPFVARRVIADANLDVIAMQEAFDAIDPTSLATFERTVVNYPLSSYYWHTETPTAVAGFNKGKGVASAFQMRDTTYSATPAQGVIHTTLLIGGRRVSFYCIHMPYSANQATMKTYVDALYAIVAADTAPYKIVAGDFNSPRSTDDVTALSTFVAAGYTHAHLTLDWENTIQDVGDAGYLDNVLVSPGLEIIDAGVLPAYSASDHRLLWADVTFTDSALSSALVAAKGDLIVGAADGAAMRLPVGATDGHTLVVNSATAAGLAWAAPAGGATTALYLPGVASNTITMPDSDALDITGDLDIRVKAARSDWASSSTSSLVEKQGTSPALAWTFYTASGWIYFRCSSDGGATQQYVGKAIDPTSASQALWLRVTVDVDNGAGGNTVTLYKSLDGTNWTQLGTPTLRAGVIALATNAAAVNVGSRAGTADAFAGLIYAAEIRNGIDGPVVAKWDGSWPHTRQRDAYGNIWTVNGSGSAWQVV